MPDPQGPTNPELCGASGALSDADTVKLQNLPTGGSIANWNNQELTCGLPTGHDLKHHVQQVFVQEFTKEVVWWAAWLDIDGLRDQAAMFTAPICGVTAQEVDGEGYDYTCLLMDEHVTDDDRRHIFL